MPPTYTLSLSIYMGLQVTPPLAMVRWRDTHTPLKSLPKISASTKHVQGSSSPLPQGTRELLPMSRDKEVVGRNRHCPLSMFSPFLVFQDHVSHSCLIFVYHLENFGQPCSTSRSHCPLTVCAQRLSFLHDPAPMCMPHITAHWRALGPATKPHLTTNLRVVEHHARALMPARLRAHVTPARMLLCLTPARPQRHSLASCCVRHLRILLCALPSIACAHAAACTLLPCPSQRASPALFPRSPQACPLTAMARHKAPKRSYGSWPPWLTVVTEVLYVTIFGLKIYNDRRIKT